MRRQRIVFMGSPDFAIPALDALHRHHDVLAVYSQPPRKSGRGMAEQLVPIAAHADSLGLPTYWPENLKDAETQNSLAAFEADLFIVVAYGLLLPQAVLDMPRFGCLNGHASLLPRWRGAAPIQRAIQAGDAHSGISVMVMEAGLDTGSVVACRRIDIADNETAGSLHDKLAITNADLLLTTVNKMPTILSESLAQDDEAATYAAKINSAEAQIDWHSDAVTLDRHIRAFSPFPGAWFPGPKGRIKVSKAVAGTGNMTAGNDKTVMPGTYLGQDEEGAMKIATGSGHLKILRLQPAGKKPMLAADFLNGQPIKEGILLAGTDDGAS